VRKLDFSQLGRFVAYGRKQFRLPLLAGCFADSRPQPAIPGRAVGLSLLLGEVAQIPSFLQLQAETALAQWQQWMGYGHPISHDTFGYVSARMDPVQLRRGAVWINRRLKRGKAFEAGKINGLLMVSLDANEQFASDCRSCADCLTRAVTCKDAAGQEYQKTQYYHKQVYAQLSGPGLSVILDFEPLRPGEEECAAALRLLRRIRRQYGPRFFDVVVVDSWYANGPFLQTVVAELGWPVIAVLKQARYEAHQEILALTAGQTPAQVVKRNQRQVEVWNVPALRFTDTYAGPVRGVRVRERWTERQRVGQAWQTRAQEQQWIWVVAGDLDAYAAAVIRDLGHGRWQIENQAFGELTQHWHLTHCARHEPVAVVALLWIKIIAFTLLHAFAIGHGQLCRRGKATLNEVRKQIYRALLCGPPVPFFSG
jgi:hypothetical protein